MNAPARPALLRSPSTGHRVVTLTYREKEHRVETSNLTRAIARSDRRKYTIMKTWLPRCLTGLKPIFERTLMISLPDSIGSFSDNQLD